MVKIKKVEENDEVKKYIATFDGMVKIKKVGENDEVKKYVATFDGEIMSIRKDDSND